MAALTGVSNSAESRAEGDARAASGRAVLGYGLSSFSKPFLYFASAWGVVLGVRFADRLGKGIRAVVYEALPSAGGMLRVGIPAHRQHRVDWTDPEQDTIWLAVHYR